LSAHRGWRHPLGVADGAPRRPWSPFRPRVAGFRV